MEGSETGLRDMFRTPVAGDKGVASNQSVPGSAGAGKEGAGVKASGGIVAQDTAYSTGWGKGPRLLDARKFHYDRNRGVVTGVTVNFSASKADRLDPDEAGEILHRVHVALGIQNEVEERIAAFDNALFFEHFINGASMLQPGRGVLTVDGQKFDIASTLTLIGEDRLRRFFRAYADDVAAVIRDILNEYDPYDFDSRDKVGQIRQVAAKRGLSKFPEYAADSADACLEMHADVRRAVEASKAATLPPVDQTEKFAKEMLEQNAFGN